MEDPRTRRIQTEDTRSGGSLEIPPAELLDAHELAIQLEQLLKQEAETLRRFENRELMMILHRKESLVRELAQRLDDFAEAKKNYADISRCPQYLSLKTCLKGIEKLNRSNRVFIEGTLSYFEGFIDCLCPPSYHPRRVNEPGRELAAFKGLTFRKEI